MQRRIEDIQLIAKPLWLLIILQVFIAIAFLGLPQGIDVLYAFIEEFNTGTFYDTSIKLITLILSLAFWTTVSEYCARLILLLSDFSSLQITKRSRNRRKRFIRLAPKILFHFPIFIVILGFILSFITKTYKMIWFSNERINLLSLTIIIAILIVELLILRKFRYGSWKNKLFRERLDWKAKRNLLKYNGLYNVDNGNKMPFRHYKPLSNMFVWLFLISLAAIIFWAFAPVNLFEKTGSISFICMGFGSWIMMYTSLQFFTKRRILGYSIPLKSIVLLMVLIVSYINNDHPIRQKKKPTSYKRPSLSKYVEQWYAGRTNLFERDSVIRPIIVCAEGGALRTGCFSAMLLARIQEAYPNFKHQVFCYSSVSGGSLGVSFFNALCQRPIQGRAFSAQTRKFFEYDFLAPVSGKLVFGEPLNWLSPWNIPRCDRNIILEKSWESSWRELGAVNRHFWKQGFLENFGNHKGLPAQFINSTEVETGKRTLISNIKIDGSESIGAVDFFSQINNDIPFSTATGLSARFPIISSAGSIETNCGRRHYLDGGYVENKGNQTALEIIKSLPTIYMGKTVEPIVLQISFSPGDTSCKKSITFLNEFTEILFAASGTRNGRTNKANLELRELLKRRNGHYIESSLKEKNVRVPMNWTLSRNALTRIEEFCSLEILDLKNRMDKVFIK